MRIRQNFRSTGKDWAMLRAYLRLARHRETGRAFIAAEIAPDRHQRPSPARDA
jgi:hypothetical protein